MFISPKTLSLIVKGEKGWWGGGRYQRKKVGLNKRDGAGGGGLCFGDLCWIFQPHIVTAKPLRNVMDFL